MTGWNDEHESGKRRIAQICAPRSMAIAALEPDLERKTPFAETQKA